MLSPKFQSPSDSNCETRSLQLSGCMQLQQQCNSEFIQGDKVANRLEHKVRDYEVC